MQPLQCWERNMDEVPLELLPDASSLKSFTLHNQIRRQAYSQLMA